MYLGNRTTICIISFSVLIVLTVNFCKKNDKGLYHNSEHGFSIKFPSGWLVKENEKQTTVMAVIPDYNEDKIFNENINIVVNYFAKAPSLEEYNRQQKAGIKKIKNLKILDEGKIVIDQCQARWFIYSYMINDFGLKAIVYSMIKKNKSYLITCIFENENFEHYRPLFNSVILTFKFE